MKLPGPDHRIHAVTFDVGGTLLEPWPSVGVVYAETARAAGFGEFAPAELETRFRTAWQRRGTFDYSRRAWAVLVRKSFQDLIPEAGDPRLFEALWRRFAEADAWRVFPDVVPCLTALRARGLRLAVVSNWDERLPPLLHATGLTGAFEFILPSIAGPAPKPDPRLFQAAAARFQLPPAAILHVGDSRAEDVRGAQGAGFSALLLDRGEFDVGPETIRTLAELPIRMGSA